MATVVDRWKSEPERRGHGKRWQVRYRDDARHDRRRAFDRKADAVRHAREVERQLDIGTYRDPRAAAVTFEDFATGWLEVRYDLRPPTVSLYSGFIVNHLVPAFGHIPIGRLRSTHAREYMAAAKGRGMSDSLLRKTMVLAKSILKAAVGDSLIVTNPFDPVKLPRDKPREMRYLTVEQLNDLLAAITPHYRCVVLVAAVLGLRWGEVCGLRPADLNLLRGQIRITGQLAEWDGLPQRVEPKTEASVRSVAIPGFIRAELEDQLSNRSSPEYLFTSTRGGPIRRSNFIRRHLHPALHAAGLEGYVFHELRHTAVSLAVEAGAHPQTIKDRLGHASITTTLNVYGHIMPGLDDRLAEQLDDRLGEALAPQERPTAVNT
jgi:integrase